MREWARRLTTLARFGEVEPLLAERLFAEYGAQLAGGVPMTQVEFIRPADFGVEAPDVLVDVDAAKRARLAELMGAQRARRRWRTSDLDDEFELDPRSVPRVRRRQDRPARARMALARRTHPARCDRGDGRARRIRAHDPGRVWRRGSRQDGDVRRLRRIVARLDRHGLARHAQRDRRGTHPERRHGRAEAPLAAEDRQRGNPADRRVHRAEHRLRSRRSAHARSAGGRSTTSSPAPRPGSRTPRAPT